MKRKMSHGGQKSAQKVSRIIWMVSLVFFWNSIAFGNPVYIINEEAFLIFSEEKSKGRRKAVERSRPKTSSADKNQNPTGNNKMKGLVHKWRHINLDNFFLKIENYQSIFGIIFGWLVYNFQNLIRFKNFEIL